MSENKRKAHVVSSGKYFKPNEILMVSLDRSTAERFAEGYRKDLNNWEAGWGVFVQECDLVGDNEPMKFSYVWNKTIRRVDDFVLQEQEYIVPTVLEEAEDECSVQYSPMNETLRVRTIVTAMNQNDALRLCREKRQELLIKFYRDRRTQNEKDKAHGL